jgi:hypothetical protein
MKATHAHVFEDIKYELCYNVIWYLHQRQNVTTKNMDIALCNTMLIHEHVYETLLFFKTEK